MRIENEVLLDFGDVLIRPKRSTLTSRKEVELQRTYKFKHSGWEYTGVPIMAANMDGVGTFDMASCLYDHRMFTCLVKSYTLNDFTQCETEYGVHFGNHVAVSTGTSEADYAKLQEILDAYPEFHFICIDVEFGNCVRNHFLIDFATFSQFAQCCYNHVRSINFEVVTQVFAAV